MEFLLALCLILWLACGVVCYFIMKSKGYPNDSCLLHGVGGFLLGFIWLIVDICKEPCQQGVSSTMNASIASSPYDDLEKLAKLHTDGVLTDEEFSKMKSDCLAKIR